MIEDRIERLHQKIKELLKEEDDERVWLAILPILIASLCQQHSTPDRCLDYTLTNVKKHFYLIETEETSSIL